MPEKPLSREKVLELALIAVAKRLSYIANGGKFNPEIAAILEEARQAIRYKDPTVDQGDENANQ